MTNDDRTVQVPVSLIEELADQAVFAPLVAKRLRALLSQPTPTAEPEHDEACVIWTGDGFTCDCGKDDASRTEPPRIEDMAPGTTFTAEGRDGTERLCAVANIDHTVADLDDCVIRSDDWFDPSTIRDVTPPKEKP